MMGRPSLAPGRYFRLLLVGYFEGIDSERGIAWRASDSLAVRAFLRLPGGELAGVLDWSRAGVGDRDSHARGPGAPGPQAQEENLERRLAISVGSRREDREDERWPDAPGLQSRACGGPGDRRANCRSSEGRAPRPRGTEHLEQMERDHLLCRQGRQFIVSAGKLSNFKRSSS